MINTMCGRYLVTSPPELIEESFHLSERPEVHPTWNAAPTQLLPVVRERDGSNRLDHLRWGLVPSWAKELSLGNRLINARSETVADKPSFRSAYRQRRCLVVADGFYEWKREGNGKRPFCIRVVGDRPFGMAGLWESWNSPEGGIVETFTILTTTPNGLVRDIHDRMPVIIDEANHDRWLATDLQDPGQVDCLLASYPAESMTACEVSTRVNSPRNNDPECVIPVQATGEGLL